MSAATNDQKRIIHTLKHQLRLDDEIYREVLDEAYGVSSSTQLTEAQANDLIARMRNALDAQGDHKRQRWDELGTRPGMATPKQLRYIETLWSQVSYKQSHKERDAALRHFIENRFKRSHLSMLDSRTTSKVIDALKAMVANQQTKGATDARSNRKEATR